MKYRLKNGLIFILEKRKSDSVSIEAMIKVGSNYENKKISGISHFIEHMVFKGTKKRNAKDISSAIENVGGQINAYTSKERTAFFGKVPKKHYLILLNILSDIIQNPIFDSKELKKEKNVVLSEAKIWKDQPRLNQWLLLEKILWKKHPSKNPIVGTVESVKGITRNDVLSYYKKYYTPSNIILSIVGDVDENILEIIKEKFGNFKGAKAKIRIFGEEKQNKNNLIKIKKDILHSYFVIGFLGPNRANSDSYAFDIIQTLLGYGSSSKLSTEIREKRGLCYEIGTNYESEVDFGYFAINLSTDRKNLELVKKIILEEINKLKKINEEELNKVKESIEGQFLLENENTLKLVDSICFWERIKDYGLHKEYINNIKRVTKKDISKLIDKYFRYNNIVIIEQK